MKTKCRWYVLGCVLAGAPVARAGAEIAVADDFPRFIVPGQEAAMRSLRALYSLHYAPAGPKATLWDEWLSGPTLWPAVATDGRMHTIRTRWASALSARGMDADGYVATHQHASIAHQQGWPFPFWKQGGEGTWGWHFSLHGVPAGWHNTQEKTQAGWTIAGGVDRGIEDHAWNLQLTESDASVRTPPLAILPDQAPFIQLRWRADGIENAQPYLEWTTDSATEFGPDRRMYFEPIAKRDGFVFTMIPVFRSPTWSGRITRLGINFGNRSSQATAGIQALFTQYDTRHNINNQNFIRGCGQYFWWTRDLNFLRRNVQRMRLALLYLMHDLGGRRAKCIVTPFVGHDGRSGIERRPDGTKIIHSGRGVGNNYWDLIPMGHKDAYATIHYYDTLNYMAALEREIDAHPEWAMPAGPLRRTPAALRRHAAEVKAEAGRMFWNTKTGRFVCGIDIDGRAYDYGFTFINCEAVYYGFATDAQADSILQWLSGERIVEGDTAQGDDIYHWRFGPRSTTRRNIDYYGWFWSGPETIPWGGQVQDGGAVLGFSYHDLQARLKVRGPDDAWKRLQAIVRWFDEVQAEGGYRAYYKKPGRGTLQGGGPPGGLGLDREFFESILVPQIMLSGFLGFQPRADGFAVAPRLPRAWPSLTITGIHLHRLVLDVTATTNSIAIKVRGEGDSVRRIYPPPGTWHVTTTRADGTHTEPRTVRVAAADDSISVRFGDGLTVRLTRD